MDFQKRAKAEMLMTYVGRLISKGGRVEGWTFKKGPSGDDDDVR